MFERLILPSGRLARIASQFCTPAALGQKSDVQTWKPIYEPLIYTWLASNQNIGNHPGMCELFLSYINVNFVFDNFAASSVCHSLAWNVSILIPAPGYPGHCGEVVINSPANSDV